MKPSITAIGGHRRPVRSNRLPDRARTAGSTRSSPRCRCSPRAPISATGSWRRSECPIHSPPPLRTARRRPQAPKAVALAASLALLVVGSRPPAWRGDARQPRHLARVRRVADRRSRAVGVGGGPGNGAHADGAAVVRGIPRPARRARPPCPRLGLWHTGVRDGVLASAGSSRYRRRRSGGPRQLAAAPPPSPHRQSSPQRRSMPPGWRHRARRRGSVRKHPQIGCEPKLPNPAIPADAGGPTVDLSDLTQSERVEQSVRRACPGPDTRLTVPNGQARLGDCRSARPE